MAAFKRACAQGMLPVMALLAATPLHAQTDPVVNVTGGQIRGRMVGDGRAPA
jgi:hypothetical protein